MVSSAKAWVAGIWGSVTGVIGSLTVVLVGDQTLSGLTQGQWLAVVAAGVAGFGGGFGLTWSTTNNVATTDKVANSHNTASVVAVGGSDSSDIV